MQNDTARRIGTFNTNPPDVEEQFRIMANSAPVMIWIAGTDKLCYFFNSGWLRFTGRSIEAEYGNGWAEGVHHEDLERCLDIYSNAFEQQQEFKMEYRLRRHDGQYRWILDHGVPRFDAGGVFTGYIGSCIDVEDRKQQEVRLEQEVARRTLELQQAVHQLKRSNEELEQFAYAASHDLKEPLRKISVFSDALLHHASQPEQIARKISDAASRMTLLIDNLLNLSKVRKEQALFQEVDLEEVWESVQTDLELTITEKDATVTHTPLPILWAIPQQINQLLYNLLNNALKYTKGDVKPQVSLTAKGMDHTAFLGQGLPSGRDYVNLAITDNGIGFEQVEAERIFNIFHRLHSREVFPGTGVGLALCKKVVENHDGFIFAQSAPGKGATFHVLLPLAKNTGAPLLQQEDYTYLPGSSENS